MLTRTFLTAVFYMGRKAYFSDMLYWSKIIFSKETWHSWGMSCFFFFKIANGCTGYIHKELTLFSPAKDIRGTICYRQAQCFGKEKV